MKRLRDEVISSYQIKRPSASLHGGLYGLPQVPKGGSGEASESVAGGGSARKLTIIDAKTYLKKVKDIFHDQREKYDMFLDVMTDFKARRIDRAGVIARVKKLFKGHNNLIFEFNNFLPQGYEITVIDDDHVTPTINDAITYVNEVKDMFQDHREKYDMFLDVMADFKAKRIDTTGVIARVEELFKRHNNLLFGFNTFLPQGYEIDVIDDDVYN